MKKYFEQIGNGVIVAFAVIGVFLFLLNTIEKITSGDIPMAVAFLGISLLLLAYIIKKLFGSKNNSK